VRTTPTKEFRTKIRVSLLWENLKEKSSLKGLGFENVSFLAEEGKAGCLLFCGEETALTVKVVRD